MNAQNGNQQLSPLEELIPFWIQQNNYYCNTTATEGYAQCMLAYGFANLGMTDRAQQLMEKARFHLVDAKSIWPDESEVSQWLFEAFEYRIKQGTEDESLDFPDGLMERYHSIGRIKGTYAIDRARQHFRILEPWRAIDPYARFVQPSGGRTSWSSANCSRRQEIYQWLLDQFKPEWSVEMDGFSEVLSHAPMLIAEDQDLLFFRLREAWEEVHDPKDYLLEKLLRLALHLGRTEDASFFSQQLEALLQYRSHSGMYRGLEGHLSALNRLPEKSREREDLEEIVDRWFREQRLHTRVLGAKWHLNQQEEARLLVDQISTILDHPQCQEGLPLYRLAIALLEAANQAPEAVALSITEHLFQLPGMGETYSTACYFSLGLLRMIETAILGVVHRFTDHSICRL